MTNTLQMTVTELVDGKLDTPSATMDGWLTDPDTGSHTQQQVSTTLKSVDAALDAAHRVHSEGSWGRLPASERAAVLARFSAVLADIAEDMAFADSIDSGVPLGLTREIVAATVGVPGAIAADAGSLLYSQLSDTHGSSDQYWIPWGPVVVFTPWNAPAPMALSKISAALAVGAPVILKPSEWSPHSASLIARAAVSAGLPAGVLQVVHGGAGTGARLVADPRVGSVSYTGGVTGGRAIAQACAQLFRPVDLELSGCNPVMVLADADIDAAAATIAGGMRALNGQWCAGPPRVFVPTGLVDEVTEAILDVHTRETVIGSVFAPETTLGSMAHEDHYHKVRSQIAELETAGAQAQSAGELPKLGGHFIAPTVISGLGRPPVTEEIFGPVITLAGYENLNDAIVEANEHPFGLSGYVLTADRDEGRRVGRELRAGYVAINSIDFDSPRAGASVGMWGSSGVGSLGGAQSLRFFTGARWVG